MFAYDALHLAMTQTQSLWMPIVAPPVLRPTVVAYNSILLSIGGVVGGKPQKDIYMSVDKKQTATR